MSSPSGYAIAIESNTESKHNIEPIKNTSFVLVQPLPAAIAMCGILGGVANANAESIPITTIIIAAAELP